MTEWQDSVREDQTIDPPLTAAGSGAGRTISSEDDTACRPGLGLLRLAILLPVAGVFGWALLGANEARVAESQWNEALAAQHNLQADNRQGSEEEYRHLLDHAAATTAAGSDSIDYRCLQAIYNRLSLSSRPDPNTGRLSQPANLPARRADTASSSRQ